MCQSDQCDNVLSTLSSYHVLAHHHSLSHSGHQSFYFLKNLKSLLKEGGKQKIAISPGISSKKEVFQPHLPVRLPCYDLAPVTSFTLGGSLRLPTLGTPSFHGLTGGVYKVRERIHRAIADARLLAIPASCSRVADYNLN